MNIPPKILIVDDEPRMCKSLHLLLSSCAYNVHTALSGMEALELVRETTYDIAVLDLFLPDMSGTELMGYIKQNGPETSVIIMTGNASVESAISALRKGAYDYLKKPFEIDQLKKIIENALQKRRLELDKAEINHKLTVSEEKYKYLVCNSPDIIYVLDARGHFTFISDAVERLLGVKPEEFVGKHYTCLLPEDQVERTKWFFQERRTGERASKGVELRMEVNGSGRPDSKKRSLTVELKSTGVYEQVNGNGAQKYVGTYGVARDITLRKQMEAQFTRAARMEALGTLAGGIAHNFNNILMAIQGNASLCLLDIDLEDKICERLRNIVLYVENGAKLTRQLIGFARGESFETEPTDMNALVHRSAELFSKARKEIVFHENLMESLWFVRTDPHQIEQVLMNIFINAWHAMPGGGDILLATQNILLEEGSPDRPTDIPPGKYVHIQVRDTGVGMDDEVKERIFEPFFTTKDVGQGTGLGMASSFGIIRSLGGCIQAESQKGEGTTIHLFLPAAEGAHAAASIEEKTPKYLKGSETLLVVDDEEMILDTSKELFQELGYKVLAAENGADAVSIYESNWRYIDLVILDMVMPGMDGKAVYEELKKINPDLKCLLATGHSIEGQSAVNLMKSCNGYIFKPFDLEMISHKFREILDN